MAKKKDSTKKQANGYDLTPLDIHLFKEGNHFKLYEKLGAHCMTMNGTDGVWFAVWAPNAERVSVVGDFNGWNRETHPLNVRNDESGIWEGFIPDVERLAVYKFHIVSRHHQFSVDNGDPFAFSWELPPKTGSRVWNSEHAWGDQKWMKSRKASNALSAPCRCTKFISAHGDACLRTAIVRLHIASLQSNSRTMSRRWVSLTSS